ncbi:MAG: 2-oxo acid dehydrogenase subunit E2 [Planctomycetia bacterium]|nr:2-oxo acid dehydrogenase subunit E2 [Planctomycetia bacterium]
MATEIKLQKLGENLEGGKVLDVKVEAGATVVQGQPLVEVEAEKAAVEVLAPEAGKVTQVLVQKDDQVTVGQTLCVLDGANGAVPAQPQEKAEPTTEKPQTASPPQPQPQAVSQPQSRLPAASQRPVQPRATTGTDKPVPAGPATRRLARELGIDLQLVTGTAPAGRVTPEDVKAYVRQLATGLTPVSAAAGPVAAPPLPDFERWGGIEKKPLEQVRRKTAEHLSRAWNLIPHVTQHDLADITDLEAFRKSQEGNGPKLTVTGFALKAAAIALREFPQFNSSIDLAKGQLIFKHYVHIGIAVDTDRGLLVPVIRDVDQKTVYGLASELTEIAQRARDKQISVDDMRGGCFTISNLGGLGGVSFTPIVNWPEVAILGLSRARLQPVIQDGQVTPRLMLTLSLSYDHRVIDGADGARFCRRIADLLENPLKMLLHA